MIPGVILFLTAPGISFLLSESMLRNPFKYMYLRAVPLNLAVFYLTALLLFMIFGSERISLITVTFFSMLFATANMYVYRFRSVPIEPWDIRSFKTAMSVAGEYDWSLSPLQVILLVLSIALILCEWIFARLSLGKPFSVKKAAVRIACALLSFAALSALFLSLWDEHTVQKKYRLYDKLFTPDTMQYRDGTFVAFIMELKYLVPSVPEGYSPEKAREILKAHEHTEKGGKTPNIIVVMDEAFSDLKVLGDYETDTDPMPFLHSLQQGGENAVTGTLNMSVKGGNTPNSEFEFLTGNTMAFLTDGSIPYQQYMSGPVPSLVSELEEAGYETTAMHPYRPGGWNRDKVYGWFGFDNVYFEDDFKKQGFYGLIREYVSDLSDFGMIKDVFEKNREETGKPQFIFNVTMQNHSPYTKKYGNFKPDVHISGIDSDASVNMYLSLMKETDAALKELLEYFENEEEETVVVFFGDHQPADSVADPVWKLNGVSSGSLTMAQNCDRYKVPFLIWANYDIKEECGLDTSANFLSSIAFRSAGISLSPYQDFLLEQMEDYPVISAKRVSDKSGEIYLYEDVKEGLSDYAIVEYYRIFGGEEE